MTTGVGRRATKRSGRSVYNRGVCTCTRTLPICNHYTRRKVVRGLLRLQPLTFGIFCCIRERQRIFVLHDTRPLSLCHTYAHMEDTTVVTLESAHIYDTTVVTVVTVVMVESTWLEATVVTVVTVESTWLEARNKWWRSWRN